MAQKRMFSKSITNSSRFLMMPQSSQNLYFHLGMNADDDGFCEHFTIMRMTESKPDDLKILQAKQFIKVFDDHVLVILDWKENNYLRQDRYDPSKYLEIYKNEIIQLSNGIPPVSQNVDKMDTQIRLDKISIDKIRIDKIKDEDVYYKNDFFIISKQQYNDYQNTYKGLNIDNEFNKMKIWMESNPSRRKTKKGYPKFVNGWLNRTFEKIKPEIKSEYQNFTGKDEIALRYEEMKGKNE